MIPPELIPASRMTPEQVWEFCDKCQNHPNITQWSTMSRQTLHDGDVITFTFAEWGEVFNTTIITINNRTDYGYVNDA